MYRAELADLHETRDVSLCPRAGARARRRKVLCLCVYTERLLFAGCALASRSRVISLSRSNFLRGSFFFLGGGVERSGFQSM